LSNRDIFLGLLDDPAATDIVNIAVLAFASPTVFNTTSDFIAALRPRLDQV